MSDARPPQPNSASGDAALEEAVRRYLPMVYAAARRQVTDPGLAEDVTQAVFIVLARRYASLPADVVLSSWLLKVTHLSCLQALRDAGRRKQHERRAAQMRSAITPARDITDNQLTAEADAALSRLKESDRAVLALRYLEQKSVAEVAQHLKISEDAAQKRIDRAMERLRKKLGTSRDHLGDAAMSAFFLAQSQILAPEHLVMKVGQAVAAVKSAGAATTTGAISHAVMKSMFWSSIKVPLVVCGAAAIAVAAYWADRSLFPPPADEDAPVGPPTWVAAIDNMHASPSNLPGVAFPRVDNQRHASFRLYAPEARRVSVKIEDTFTMFRDKDGYWSVTTPPLPPGFHYYQFSIDGALVDDPGTQTFFGVSKTFSGFEVPDEGVDFYADKDVPHGDIRARYYDSSLSGKTRLAYVYTPPGYDNHPDKRYPVVYLLAGVGEDQRAWVEQGRVATILDNLIAEGKAREMIAVMDDPGTGGGFATGPVSRGGANRPSNFERIFAAETIPMIDRTYRTLSDRDHRALVGASFGATQSFEILRDNLDKFAYFGAFSAPTGYPAIPNGLGGLLQSPEIFSSQIKAMYISSGANENNNSARMFHDQLESQGIPHVYFEAPGNSHGWQTWRKSFYGMAPMLFQDKH